jgi:hypothetical protein
MNPAARRTATPTAVRLEIERAAQALSAAMQGRTKRLVSLPLEPDQEREILRLLDAAGIAHRETRSKSRLLGSDAIWVAQGDYPRAKEILDREAAGYAAAARETWQAEWHREHGGSYARWLTSRLRRATIDDVLRALLLIALVALMLLYPLSLMR